MSGIQLLLLTGIVFIALYFVIRWKNRVFDILLLFAMVTSAIVFILWPDVTNEIAKFLGVGRGADLVFYISILIFWFVVLKLYSRIRRLERDFTDFIRRDALHNATRFSEASGETPTHAS